MGLAAPQATAWSIDRDAAWMATSMLVGERFFPAS